MALGRIGVQDQRAMKHPKHNQSARQSGAISSKTSSAATAMVTGKAKGKTSAENPVAPPSRTAAGTLASAQVKNAARKVAKKVVGKVPVKPPAGRPSAPGAPAAAVKPATGVVPHDPLRPHVGPRYVDPLDYPTHPYPSMQRFAEHLALGSTMPRTRHSYYRSLRLIHEYFRSDPATLTEDQFRDYILYVKTKKNWEPKTIRQAAAAAKLFFVECSEHEEWKIFSQIRTKDEDSLPAVLTREEVIRLLRHIRLRRYRIPVKLIYCCGLRVSECLSLTIHDIDAHGRQTLDPQEQEPQGPHGAHRPIHGRGPAPLLGLSTAIRCLSSPASDAVPATSGTSPAACTGPSRPMPVSTLERLMVAARKELNIPVCTSHTLRHSLRHPSGRGRREPAHRPGPVRPQRHQHHHDLSAPHPPQRAGQPRAGGDTLPRASALDSPHDRGNHGRRRHRRAAPFPARPSCVNTVTPWAGHSGAPSGPSPIAARRSWAGTSMPAARAARASSTSIRCNHRSCPQCGKDATAEWVERELGKRVGAPYFMVTFTLPRGAPRSVLHASRQRDIHHSSSPPPPPPCPTRSPIPAGSARKPAASP